MSNQPSLEPATTAEVLLIRDLAERIWHASYEGILTSAQIRYMLEWMYAPHKLEAEIERGVNYWIVRDGPHAVGYFAWELTERGSVAFLNKLYLLPSRHGKGWGQVLLNRFLADARSAGAAVAELRVNRGNERALKAYYRAGFTRTGTCLTDIGAGFVMDDFILRRGLPAGERSPGTDVPSSG